MDNKRVDPAGDPPGVTKVSVEVEALSNATSRDGGGGGSEGPLVEEVSPLAIPGIGFIGGPRGAAGSEVAFETGEAEEGITNHWVGSVTLAVGKGKPDAVEANSGDASVENGLEENVHGILGPDGTRTKHGEASVHDKDEGAA